MQRPEILSSGRAEERLGQLRAYVTEQAQSDVQQHRPPIDRDLISFREILDKLAIGFGDACAYCESGFESTGGLSVGHHRPAGFAAGAGGQTDLLHYVWLAYDWENLYPVCGLCNKTQGNLFPVDGQRGELLAPVEMLRATERPLLLDPCFDDPSQHLRFAPDGLIASKSPAGAATIELLHLDRAQLSLERRAACSRAVALIDSGWLNSVGTGLPSGWGAEVPGKAGDYPHPGATGLALLEVAQELGLPTVSLSKLLRLLRKDDTARARFLRAFAPRTVGTGSVPESGFTKSAPPPSDANPRKAVARRPSRTFHAARQPLSKLSLKSVRIENFKAVREIGFELPIQIKDAPDNAPCMILLGENAAGKSSVLEALTLALLGANESQELNWLLKKEDEEVSPKDAAHRPDPDNWDKVGADPVSVRIDYHASEAITQLTGGPKDELYGGDAGTAKVLLAYGPRRFFSTRRKQRHRAPAYRVRSLFDPMATIADPSEWLLDCSDSVFDAAVRAMREILMLGETGAFTRDRSKGKIFVGTEGGRLPLSELSVGYKSVIALATDIMRELMRHYDNLEHAHAVVVIDEIETHLHPRWKMRIVGALRQAFPKVQFIISTHDPLCLRGMYPGEVFVLRRREKDNRVEQLEDLPDVRGMRAEQILTSEFFGLGSTDPETDAKLAHYHELVASGASEVDTAEIRQQLSDRMKFGDTIQEQVFAEAMRKADIDPLAPLGKIESKSREAMVSDLLTVIQAPLQAGPEPAQ